MVIKYAGKSFKNETTRKKFIQRQINYFTKKWKKSKKLKDMSDYSNRIYFWEKEKRKRR